MKYKIKQGMSQRIGIYLLMAFALLYSGVSTSWAQSGFVHIKLGPQQPTAGGGTSFGKVQLPQGSPPWSWIKHCSAVSFNGIAGPLDTAAQFVLLNIPILAGAFDVHIICEAETLQKLEATPAIVTLDGYGSSAQIHAIGTFKNGTTQPLSLDTDGTSYTSSDPKVASVSATGVITALAQGSATITIKNGSQSASVQVNAQVGAITGLLVNPATLRFSKAGQQQALQVFVCYANGAQREITAQASLASDTLGVATVSAQTVTAVDAGRALITITAAGQSTQLLVIVSGTARLQSLAALPSPISFKTKGEIAKLQVTGTYSDNSTLDLTPGSAGTSYVSSAPNVATVSADGEVEAIANGNAIITISHTAGSKPSTTVAVTVQIPTLLKIAATPNPIRLKTTGETAQITLTGSYSDTSTRDLTTNKLTTYQSADPTIATVSATGLVTAIKLGTTTITARYDGQQEQIPVQIATRTLASIAFAKASISMVQNTVDTTSSSTTLQLTATYDDNSTADITADAATSYLSSQVGTATVSAQGVVFAAANPGTSIITATHNGKQATTTINITQFAIQTTAKLDLTGTLEDVAVIGKIAYVAAGTEGVHLVDVSDPTKPVLLRTLRSFGSVVFVQGMGDHLLMGDRKGGLHLAGVHDVRTADIVQTISMPSSPAGEAYGAAYWQAQLFVAAGKAGVLALDLTDITAPQQRGATGAGEIIAVAADARWLAAVDTDKILLFDRQLANWWSLAPTQTIAVIGARRIIASGSATPGTFYTTASDGLYLVNAQGQSQKLTVTGASTFNPTDIAQAPGWMLTSGPFNSTNLATLFLHNNPLLSTFRATMSMATFGTALRAQGIDTQGGYLFLAANASSTHQLQIGQYRQWVDYDTKKPTVSLTYPTDNSTITERQDLHFVVAATDDREVTKVEYRINGSIVATQTTRPFRLSYPAPNVTASTKVLLDVIAYDPAGNAETSSAITVNITPISDTQAPTVSIRRPVDGSEAEIGEDLLLKVDAKDDQRVAEVHLYVDNNRVATLYRPPFAYQHRIPASTADETSFKIRAEVIDYGGNLTKTSDITILAIKLVALTQDISAADQTQDNKRVAVRGRTIKIDGSHTFKSLWVDQGGILQHSAATTTQADTIDISAGYVYIADGAKIDVTGLGYLAASSGGNGSIGRTRGNSTTGGANFNEGGAHGGPGGHAKSQPTPATAYDSLFDPKEPGGGAGSSATVPGNGGGVVRLQCSVLVLDGAILAQGGGSPTTLYAPGGAGGSVLLKTQGFYGTGEVRANGGGPQDTSQAAGAGGRIAVYASDFNNFDISAITAYGTGARTPSAQDSFLSAGAGSIFLKTTAQTHGTLIIDNGSPANLVQVTPLPQVGKSTNTSVSISTLTNTSAAWEPGQLVGHWVNPNIQQNKSFRIIANTATTLTLDTGGDDLTTLASTGSTYHGILFLDALIIRGRASISTADQLRIGIGASGNNAGLTLRDAVLDSASLALDPGSDVTLDNSQLLLRQALTLRSLRLQNGALLTTPATTSAATFGVQLTLTQSLDIDAQSKIDVSGKGYRMGSPATLGKGFTHNNDSTEGANFGAGGSHGGTGETNRLQPQSKPNATYGSMFSPSEPGAGGGCLGSFTCPAGAGGGLVVIKADSLLLDGMILADGEVGISGGSGAGGGVSIDVRLLGGGGTISAKGGDAYQFSSHGAGGGGRVAIRYTTLQGFDPVTQVSLLPGVRKDALNSPAGAGTLYLKTPTQSHGTLRIDQAQMPVPSSGFVTRLLSIGQGTITALSANQLTDTNDSFAPDDQLAGLWLKPNVANGTLYLVLTNDATALRTRPSDGDMTSGAAIANTYRGVLRLDAIILNGGARANSLDELLSTTTQVSADSAFQAQNLQLPQCPATCTINADCQVFGCGAKTTCLSTTCQ